MPEQVAIQVDGRQVPASPGSSLLAALWNAGVLALRHSVGGEPRGALCAMGTCFECRVTIDGQPDRRACLEPVAAGMRVETGSLAPGPTASPARLDVEADVAVVGAGPAGIAAACRAAQAGARVVVLDGAAAAGGPIWRGAVRASRGRAAWLSRLAASGARCLEGAAVVDAEPGRLLAVQAGGPLLVQAGALVLCTGSRERFLPFSGWTLPGALGAGAAQLLAKSGASFRGQRVVVAGSGPLLLPAAATLAGAGAQVLTIAEQAPPGAVLRFGLGLLAWPGKLAEAARYRLALSAPYRCGTWVAAAHGERRVQEVELTDGRRSWRLPCDVLACGFGLLPALELPLLLGCAVEAGAVRVDDEQRTSVPGVFAAGEATGVGGADLALAEGEIAGLAAAAHALGRALPQPAAPRRLRERGRAFARRLEAAFALRPELLRPDDSVLLCRCEDVSCGRVKDLASAREAKLATRAGMGACQGRVCGGALQALRGFGPDAPRAPLLPVPLGVLAEGWAPREEER
jgi:NADPH-dependent 2,4-dienoyl-CoA reductase/sulfur reductase-like enzyme